MFLEIYNSVAEARSGLNRMATVRPHRDRASNPGSMSIDDTAGVESTGTTAAASLAKPTSAIDWHGPFSEPDGYGGTTGYTYLKCPDCGIEVLTGHRNHATHRPECVHR